MFIQVKNGLLALDLPLHEVDGGGGRFVVDRLHALRVERAGVLDLAVGGRLEHAARRVRLDECRVVLRIVGPLRLLLGIEVVEVAEEFVEAVLGRQVFVAVAEMVLAELAGGIAERLERLGDGDVAVLQADRRAGNADLAQAGAQADLAGDEGRAARRAAVLGVVVGEHHAFLGDAVDVRRLVAHQPAGIGADVGLADVVAEDDEDVRLRRARLLGQCRRPRERRKACCNERRSEQGAKQGFGFWLDVVAHSTLSIYCFHR